MTNEGLIDVSAGKQRLLAAKDQLQKAKNELVRARAAGLTALADQMEPKIKESEQKLNRLLNAYR